MGITSYAADLAYTLSRNAREYYQRGGGILARGFRGQSMGDGKGRWTVGGWRGWRHHGKGFHLGIVDDPLKDAEEAQSVVTRERIKDWYSSTFYTRQSRTPVSS